MNLPKSKQNILIADFFFRFLKFQPIFQKLGRKQNLRNSWNIFEMHKSYIFVIFFFKINKEQVLQKPQMNVSRTVGKCKYQNFYMISKQQKIIIIWKFDEKKNFNLQIFEILVFWYGLEIKQWCFTSLLSIHCRLNEYGTKL